MWLQPVITRLKIGFCWSYVNSMPTCVRSVRAWSCDQNLGTWAKWILRVRLEHVSVEVWIYHHESFVRRSSTNFLVFAFVCRFDFLVTFTAVLGIFLELIQKSFYYIIIIRPLRLLRLASGAVALIMTPSWYLGKWLPIELFFLQIVQSEKKISGCTRNTVHAVVKDGQVMRKRRVVQSFDDTPSSPLYCLKHSRNSRLLSSVIVVLVILYYFYAIIGIEVFSRYNMKNCCKWVIFHLVRFAPHCFASGCFPTSLQPVFLA